MVSRIISVQAFLIRTGTSPTFEKPQYSIFVDIMIIDK